MKKITLFVFLLAMSIGYAQQSLVQDFETGSEGLGEPFGGAAAEIVADPETAGTRGQVAKLTSSATGEVWQGLNVNITSNVELTSDKTMKIDIYSLAPVTIAPRVQGGLDGAPVSTAVVSHTGSGWETLTITFNTGSNGDATAEGVYEQFVIYYLWDNGFLSPAVERVIYADNITGIIEKQLVQDFETGSEGLGEPFGGAAAEIVADPETAGTRGQVAKLTSSATGEVWQGLNVNITSNVELTSDKTMKIDIYSLAPVTIAPRVQGGLDGAPVSTAVVSHTGSGWETLTITFNTGSNGDATAEGVYEQFVIYYLWDNGFLSPAVERVIYADNIKGIRVTPPVAPPVPAPTDAPTTPPSFAAQNVISLYSEAYTASTSISNADWDDSSMEEVTIAGNKVLKVTGANFLGLILNDYLDVTDMTHLHMDYWIGIDHKEGMVLNPKLSNHALQDGETSALDISNPITGQSEVKNWQSKDFALNGDRASIKEFLITQAGFANVYYIDNIYMYVEGTASVDNNKLLGFSMFPNPASNRLNISAKETIKNADVFNVLGKKVMSVNVNDTKASIDISTLTSGIYLVKYNVNNKVGTAKFIKE